MRRGEELGPAYALLVGQPEPEVGYMVTCESILDVFWPSLDSFVLSDTHEVSYGIVSFMFREYGHVQYV